MPKSGFSHQIGHQLGGAIDTVKRQAMSQLTGQLTRQLTSLSRLFLNPGCAVCDRPGRHTFCLDCQRQLPVTPAVTATVTAPTQAAHPVQNWYQDATHSLPVSALGVYGGTLKRAILAMKYNHRPEVAEVLGHQLGKQWQTQRTSAPLTSAPLTSTPLTSTPPLVSSAIVPFQQIQSTLIYAVPIPLHAKRRSQRGYNQAELIARAFCKTSRLPLLVDGLVRTQATLPQHQLSLSERQQNLAEAFYPGKALQRITRVSQGKKTLSPQPAAVIIDDIYTTGTTARSAAKTLTEAGMPVIGILALARAVL